MSIEAMAIVLHHSRSSGTAKVVALGIANHDGDGGAWPTIATLAHYANVSERAVRDAIAQLVALGEVVVRRKAGGHRDDEYRRRPNLYELRVCCPVGCDGTKHHRSPRSQRQVPLPIAEEDFHEGLGMAEATFQEEEPVTGSTPHSLPEAGFTPLPEVHHPRTVLENTPKNTSGSVGASTTDARETRDAAIAQIRSTLAAVHRSRTTARSAVTSNPAKTGERS